MRCHAGVIADISGTSNSGARRARPKQATARKQSYGPLNGEPLFRRLEGPLPGHSRRTAVSGAQHNGRNRLLTSFKAPRRLHACPGFQLSCSYDQSRHEQAAFHYSRNGETSRSAPVSTWTPACHARIVSGGGRDWAARRGVWRSRFANVGMKRGVDRPDSGLLPSSSSCEEFGGRSDLKSAIQPAHQVDRAGAIHRDQAGASSLKRVFGRTSRANQLDLKWKKGVAWLRQPASSAISSVPVAAKPLRPISGSRDSRIFRRSRDRVLRGGLARRGRERWLITCRFGWRRHDNVSRKQNGADQAHN